MARILIADDDPQASEVIARICQFKGHEVQESRDTVQALAEFERFHPDLLITDLAMPLGGGQRLVEEIRALTSEVPCPVIVITGYAGLLGARERESLQPCTILEKPLQLEPMLEALDRALGSADPSSEGR
jgi:DNA-binding NtrC family response regulator